MTAKDHYFYIKQNDRLPAIVEYLRNSDRSPIDLTGGSVKFHLLAPDGTVKVNATATIVNAAAGLVQYDWGATDTDTVGLFQREWEVTLSGLTITIPNNENYPVLIYDDIA